MAGTTKEKRTLESLEINGGALCLNFVNTVNSRPDPRHDYLMTYSDLAGWGGRVGLLSTRQLNRLQRQAGRETEKADEALRTAKMLRELLYRLFSNLTRQVEPRRQDMDVFVRFYGEAVSSSHFVRRNDFHSPDWETDRTYGAMLWPISYSAGQLLLSRQLTQVKECPACGWLFLDTSRNQSRRWCSMNTCGVSDKMRRYYRKSQNK